MNVLPSGESCTEMVFFSRILCNVSLPPWRSVGTISSTSLRPCSRALKSTLVISLVYPYVAQVGMEATSWTPSGLVAMSLTQKDRSKNTLYIWKDRISLSPYLIQASFPSCSNLKSMIHLACF